MAVDHGGARPPSDRPLPGLVVPGCSVSGAMTHSHDPQVGLKVLPSSWVESCPCQDALQNSSHPKEP